MSSFTGFEYPEQNWSKLPHALVARLGTITSLAELKIILYILRHTWGFQEFGTPKRITLDEFQNGRKRRDGSRLDNGVGMSRNSIKDGISRAITDGFIIQTSDGRDAARNSHEYQLLMVSEVDSRGSEVDTLPSEVDTLPSEVDTRSEKDTNKDTNKDTIEEICAASAAAPSGPGLLDQFLGSAHPAQPPEPAGGNHAVPVQAGGNDSPALAIVNGICRYNGLTQGADSLPTKKRTQWMRHVAEMIAGWGGATTAQAHLAWQAWTIDYAWKGQINPFYKSFDTEIGPLLVGVREGSITTQTLQAKAQLVNGKGKSNANSKLIPKPPADPVDPAVVARQRESLRAHRQRQPVSGV